MANFNNDTVKRLLEKITKKLLETKEFSHIQRVEIYYVFGSKIKTAFCDYVYGMKVSSKTEPIDNFTISSLQRKMQLHVDKIMKTKVCCTDVMKEVGHSSL